MIFLTLGFKLENLSRTLKRFEGVCPTNLLDFSELGTFGLAKWQRDMVTTLKKVQWRVKDKKYEERKKKNYQKIQEIIEIIELAHLDWQSDNIEESTRENR